MSYRFTMNFKKVNSELEAIKIINKIQNRLLVKENFEKFIDDNFLYYVQKLRLLDIEIKNVGKIKYFNQIQDMIELSTKIPFCYWANYKLLGVVGEGETDIGFDKTIFFQNSSDQDYPYSNFEGLCVDIDNEIKKAKTMSVEELSHNTDYDVESIEGDIDYYRRTYIYDYVYKLLDLDNFLWRKEFKKENMFVFNMSIPVAYNHFELYEWFVDIMKKKIKNQVSN